MKIKRFWRYPWLCLCLILLFAACSSLRNTGSEQAYYRVTITLPPGSTEDKLIVLLDNSQTGHIDFSHYTGGYDDARRLNGSRTIIITLVDQMAVQRFRQNLLNVGMHLQGIQIQKVN